MCKRVLILFSIILIALVSLPETNAQRKSARKSTTTRVQKQNGTVTGVVRYKYNDYQEYKADLGATVIAVSKIVIDTIMTSDEIKEYEELAHKRTQHMIARKELMREGLNGDLAHSVVAWSEANENKFKALDSKFLELFVAAKKNKTNIAMVDASGSYSMVIPYGEYYIVFKSKNRDRQTVAEITGRVCVKALTLNSTTEIMECDFDY